MKTRPPSSSRLFCWPIRVTDTAFSSTNLSDEEIAAYEAYASDMLGAKLIMSKTPTQSSTSGSSPSGSISSAEGLTLKLFDAPKPQQAQDSAPPSSTLDSFSLPLSPPYLTRGKPAPAPMPLPMTASSRKVSTLLGSSSNPASPGAVFEPLVYQVYISRRAPAHQLVRLSYWNAFLTIPNIANILTC